MSKLNRMSWEQHLETGKKLQEIRNSILDMIESFGATYPKADKVNKHVTKVYDAIDMLRNELDNKVSAEYPEKRDHEVTRIYYGEEK